MLDHQAHIFNMPDPCIRVPEPETFRVAANQGSRTLHQLGRRRGWWRQFIQCIGCNSHPTNLRRDSPWSKEVLRDKKTTEFLCQFAFGEDSTYIEIR